MKWQPAAWPPGRGCRFTGFTGEVKALMSMTTIGEVLGWVAATLAAGLAMPQALRLRKRAKARNVSFFLAPWQGLLSSNLAWLVYSIVIGEVQLVISSSISATIVSGVILTGARALGRNRVVAMLVPLGIAALAVCTMWSPLLFGLLTLIPSLIGWIRQFIKIVRNGRPRDLSVYSMLISLCCQVLWLGYAIPLGDAALFVTVIPLITVLSANIIAYLVRSPEPLLPEGSERPV